MGATGTEQAYCQSCGMPMSGEELFGTERNGVKSEEYCSYCYEDGAFKQPDITMQGMADMCASYMVQDGMPEQEARALLERQLPRLKRWLNSR